MRPFFQLIFVDDKSPHNPCLLIVPSREESHYITPAFSGVPTKVDKVKSGYLNPCLLRALELGKMPKQPLRYRGPHKRGQNHNWLHNPCLLGGPRKGDKLRIGYAIPVFLGPKHWAQWLHDPYVLVGLQKRGRNTCLLKGTKLGKMGATPAFSEFPK